MKMMNQKRKPMRNNHIKGTVIVLKEGEDVNRALRRFKNKIEDLEYLKSIIEKNKIYSVENREKIREYGVNTFSLDCIIQNEYIPKLKTLLN